MIRDGILSSESGPKYTYEGSTVATETYQTCRALLTISRDTIFLKPETLVPFLLAALLCNELHILLGLGESGDPVQLYRVQDPKYTLLFSHQTTDAEHASMECHRIYTGPRCWVVLLVLRRDIHSKAPEPLHSLVQKDASTPV